MTSHLTRASAALIAALLVAALFQFVFFHIATQIVPHDTQIDPMWTTLRSTFAYGAPVGVAAALTTEFLRLRRLHVQIAIGTFAMFAATLFATRSEPLTSYVFTVGTLAPIGIFVTGAMASFTYWAIAGRRAGWRGDAVEEQYRLATSTFQRASEQHTEIKLCRTCIAVWAAATILVFALAAWVMIDRIGVHHALVVGAEREGRLALRQSGHTWASFEISDGRGTIVGNAPSELDRRKAHDTIRHAMYAVTGFPGVVSGIDNKATAPKPLVAVNQELVAAMYRDQQEKQAIRQARRAERPPPAGEQGPETKQEEQSTDQQNDLPRAADESAKPTETASTSAGVQDVAALATDSNVAPSAQQVGASVPTPNSDGTDCTDQDVALVESSQIFFQPQSFEILGMFAKQFDRIAASVKSCPQRSIMLIGRSDANADSLFNPALALQRAEAGREALIARGVNAERIVTKGQPLGSFGNTYNPTQKRTSFRTTHFKFIEGSELIRDATQTPDERATNCETDLAEIMTKSIIHFPLGSARVSEESLGLIARLAQAIQECGSVIVTVEGHTDKIGSHQSNQQLSIARAEAVREALAEAGADPTRLASRGFASTRPLAVEDTAEAYALNRRIEFKVSGKFTTTKIGGP